MGLAALWDKTARFFLKHYLHRTYRTFAPDYSALLIPQKLPRERDFVERTRIVTGPFAETISDLIL